MEVEPLVFNRRIPELDGLRGIAILLVLYYHYFESAPLPSYLASLGRLTWSGVDLFFVLSGFLVGGILLDVRLTPHYFKTFFIRRAHRILPLYALVCLLFWLIGGNFVDYNQPFYWLFSNPWPWYAYATFTQNFFMTADGTLGPAWLGATWSLAVEEQFYLTLPLLIRFANRRHLAYILAFLILSAPLIRTSLRLYYLHGDVGAYVLMPCRADALMLGVMVALLIRNRKAWQFLMVHKRFLLILQVVLLCGMAWMALKTTEQQVQPPILQVLVQPAQVLENLWQVFWHHVRLFISSLNYTWIAAFYTCLLLITITHSSSWVNHFLRSRLLVEIGAIAYGAYLFHQPVLGLCYGLVRDGLPIINNSLDWGITVIAFALTLLLAKASWIYWEKPFVERGHKYIYTSSNRLSKLHITAG